MITIPKNWLTLYPNDMELGREVRKLMWKSDSFTKMVCTYCGGDTSEVEYDYLVNTDHLECVIKMNP